MYVSVEWDELSGIEVSKGGCLGLEVSISGAARCKIASTDTVLFYVQMKQALEFATAFEDMGLKLRELYNKEEQKMKNVPVPGSIIPIDGPPVHVAINNKGAVPFENPGVEEGV